MLKALGAWLLMLLLAIANGAARDLCYGQYLGELTAHQLSTIIAAVLLGGVMRAYVRRYPPPSRAAALLLGLFWAGLTVTFEFFFSTSSEGAPGRSCLQATSSMRDSCGRCWCCGFFSPR